MSNVNDIQLVIRGNDDVARLAVYDFLHRMFDEYAIDVRAGAGTPLKEIPHPDTLAAILQSKETTITLAERRKL